SLTIPELAASGLFYLADDGIRKSAMEWAVRSPGYRQPWDRASYMVEATYAQAPANRAILEKIYLRLRERVTPEETAPTAILRCLQEGLERSFDSGVRLEAEAWSSVRSARSTLNRVKIFRVARPHALSSVTRTANPFNRIGVLGAGVMGTGIACAA